MASKSLIYISSGTGPVIESQVIALLTEIKKAGYFDRIFLLSGINSKENRNNIVKLFHNQELDFLIFKRYPNYHFFNFFQRKELGRALKQVVNDNTVIHIRGEAFTGITHRIINNMGFENVRIITDIRGAAAEEMSLYAKNGRFPLAYLLKIYQINRNLRLAAIRSHHTSFVSSALKDHLFKKADFSRQYFSINPCIAGDNFCYSHANRNIYRRRLGLLEQEKLCVFIAGGTGLYQNTRYIIENLSYKKIKILNLSKESISSQCVINMFVPLSEVPGYLCAADIGIIWRGNDIVNNVASPIKFVEYLCCGLPVISNNAVLMINDYLSNTGFGKVINDFELIDDELISSLIQIDRAKISEHSRKKFSSGSVSKNYLNIYKELFNNNLLLK